VADPHEIANVLGTDGVHWLCDAAAGLPLDVYFMASSCVPASSFESPRRALTTGDLEEGRERLRAGLWLLIREASSARNLAALLPLVEEYGPHRMAFCTDDREPEHVADDGHMNAIVREAVALGASPEDAVVMASLNPAAYHGLTHVLGSIAPGKRADILVLGDLERFVPELVLKRGRPVGEIAAIEVPEWVKQTVHVGEISPRDLELPWRGGRARVIGLVPDQIITAGLEEELTTADGLAVADPKRDLAKIAVWERHLQTGRVGLGFVRGFGLARGAFGSTVAHDAHNMSVVGADDPSMVTAAARLRELGGGLVVTDGHRVLAEVPLPVAGLLSDRPLAEVLDASRSLTAAVHSLGVTFPQPVQMLAFLSLSVIPALKITDRGLVDVTRFELVPLAL
jgi:adenine deaminase